MNTAALPVVFTVRDGVAVRIGAAAEPILPEVAWRFTEAAVMMPDGTRGWLMLPELIDKPTELDPELVTFAETMRLAAELNSRL